jgi:hypothetical protein
VVAEVVLDGKIIFQLFLVTHTLFKLEPQDRIVILLMSPQSRAVVVVVDLVVLAELI